MKDFLTYVVEIQCGKHTDLCCFTSNPDLLEKTEDILTHLGMDKMRQLIKMACSCSAPPAPPAPPTPPAPSPPVPPTPVAPAVTCPNPMNPAPTAT